MFGVARTAADGVGATFETLEVDGIVYRSAKVVAVSPSTVTIRHPGGIAQLSLRKLPPELQQRFGYDPDEEALEAKIIAQQRRAAEQAAQSASSATAMSGRRAHDDTPVGRALARFGTPAPMREVDLRPRYRELELGTKSQGLRPSCAVFAVLSALEFQNAALGVPEQLSEEYLIWATRRTLGIPFGEKRLLAEGDEGDARDAGFTLQEVLAAVRAYGVPLQKQMPNTFGVGMERIPDPSEEVITTARTRRQVATYSVPGVNSAVKISNIMHALNEGVPVVVGLRWPHWRSLAQAAVLSQQTPLERRSHAVTLVGYVSNNGQPSGLRFIFKNSWGIRWGTGGYGFVEIGYLERNLLDAVVLEVRPGG
ncbi:MAG: C1 family peptidase [Opitutaceae bacterium]